MCGCSTIKFTSILLFLSFIVEPTHAVCETPGQLRNVTVKTVCYPDVGCFDTRPPFSNAKGSLPFSPKHLNVGLRLFTRQNLHKYQLLSYVNSSVTAASNFRANRKTKFVIHGFYNTADIPWVGDLKDALLVKGDFNVITVDWGNGAKPPFYDQAVANLRLVGTQVMLLLNILQTQGLKLTDVHLIGHSLGAHMSGYVGLLMGSGVARISGMDPAEPDFECLPSLVRLDPGDAIFVDVVHTNGAELLSGGAGLMQKCGHVDFFVNGGKSQPGCKDGLSGAWDSLMGSDSGLTCSHGRAHTYYIESINTNCTYTGFPCQSYEKFSHGDCIDCGSQGCSSMGYDADQFYGTGAMYLKTRTTEPFCGFQYMINVTIHDRLGKDTKGALHISLHGAYGNTSLEQVTPTTTTSMARGSSISRLVVLNTEVGPLKSITVKYVKKSWSILSWSSGEKSVFISSVAVTSAETGSRYRFCHAKYEVKSGTFMEIFSKNQIWAIPT